MLTGRCVTDMPYVARRSPLRVLSRCNDAQIIKDVSEAVLGCQIKVCIATLLLCMKRCD
jgi:hypothetical protein